MSAGGQNAGQVAPFRRGVQDNTRNLKKNHAKLEMWANAQRDSRPAECRWCPLFNAAVWLTPTTRVTCSNAAKDAKPVEITLGAPN